MLPEKLDYVQLMKIRNLSASLHELAQIQRELGLPECVASYEESLKLAERIGDKAYAAIPAHNLDNAYKDIPKIRNLAKAESWVLYSLELHNQLDHLRGRARCLKQLGHIANERLKDAIKGNKPKEELLRHLNNALQLYRQALKMTPSDATDDLAYVHQALGSTYSSGADFDRALQHYCESIRYFEEENDLYHAANTRYNVAITLADAGRFTDALEYAYAALRNFETFGDRAAKRIQETRKLIAWIEQMRTGGG